MSLFSVVSARLVYVQHVQHEKWSARLDSNRRGAEELPAARGPVFDTKGRLLACDEMVESVVFDNVFLNERVSKGATERMAKALGRVEQRPWAEIRHAWTDAEIKRRYVWWVAHTISSALGRPPEELAKAILERTNSRGTRLPDDEGETILAKELNATQSAALQKLTEAHPLAALHVRASFRRSYPSLRPLPHLVGLINANGPACGIELFSADRLKGTPGRRTYEVDGRGQEVTAFRGEFVHPKQGQALRLTIDTSLQEIVEQTLDEKGSDPDQIYVPDLDAKRVTVVLMEPKTMAIRAIACRRSDLKNDDPLLFNPAAQEPYEPGSTMKIVTLASALDSGKVDPNTMIPTNNGYYDDADIEPIHDDDAFPQLSAMDILVHSSNIGAYKLARTVGLKKFSDYVRNFGFGSPTGVECPRESRGILDPANDWTYNIMSRTSFGYNIAVTPLQMCSALGVLLNDGYFKRPHLIEAVLDAEDNRVLEETTTEPLRRVISSRAARQTRDAMRQVVERGTGTKAQSSDYTIAGKTGTARRASKAGYADGQYIVSFLGFAPAENPKYLGLVVIDTPQGEARSLYGGKIAAPIFRRIIERCLRYSEVPVEDVVHNAKPR